MDEEERVFNRDIGLVSFRWQGEYGCMRVCSFPNFVYYTQQSECIDNVNLTNQVRFRFLKTNVLIHTLSFPILRFQRYPMYLGYGRTAQYLKKLQDQTNKN